MSNQKENSKIKSEKLELINPNDLKLDIAKIEKVSQSSFAISIRALLQNWRQGTVGCKTRSEVAYSNKKPWKQKGTGRARAGSRRSPLWVGGGVVFGPQPRVKNLKINKFLKKKLLSRIIYDLLNNKKVFSLDYIATEKPKTSEAYRLIKSLGFGENKKIILLVSPNDFLTQASFANIKNIKILFFDQLNSFDLTANENLLVIKKDLDLFKEMVSRWI